MNGWKATIGINGFTMVFGLANHWYQWFCNGFWSGNHWYQWFFDGFVVQQPLDPMVFQWFPMVVNRWSNNGMVTIHRYGLLPFLHINSTDQASLISGAIVDCRRSLKAVVNCKLIDFLRQKCHDNKKKSWDVFKSRMKYF